jgi:surface antigen
MERFRSFWSRGLYPALTGDAGSWAKSATQLGWPVLTSPATKSIVVLPGSPGHVAWVDSMYPAADGIHIHIWEMNYQKLYQVSDRWLVNNSGLRYIPAPAI